MAALDFPDTPTNGQVYDKWTWNGTLWALTGAPAAALIGGVWTRAAAQSIPTTTWTAIIWDTEVSDSGGFAAPGSATVTFAASGIYIVTFNSYGGGNSVVKLALGAPAGIEFTSLTDGVTGRGTSTAVMSLIGGQTMTCQVFAAAAFSTATNMSRLELWKIG